jgi:hypothetical protein
MKQQNSPTSKSINPVQKPVKVEVKEEIQDGEDDYIDEEEDQVPSKEVKEVEKQESNNQEKEISEEQRIAMEIEMLQNNGRFRIELLHQLQEINKALVVIAGVLVDLSGKGKE